ncbi:MAG: pantetheine-phosphate adenylyltransferase [Elusimicrobiota bacterium]|jgi:pantetheine-phosphate adenylyltransferase|nr:pantetheine-phosphate adenylyltransferase [Elusimicrobiota bacterium]
MKKKKIAVYPGSFDPVTNGHIDVIKRAIQLFDRVIVAVIDNANKNVLFSVEERMEMLRAVTRGLSGVVVSHFDGLLVDYVKKKRAKVIIRGLRAVSDFEYEFQMALTNRKLAPDIETVFLMPAESYTYLSSSIVKEVVSLKGNVKGLVPRQIEARLRRKLLTK